MFAINNRKLHKIIILQNEIKINSNGKKERKIVKKLKKYNNNTNNDDDDDYIFLEIRLWVSDD